MIRMNKRKAFVVTTYAWTILLYIAIVDFKTLEYIYFFL